jgi:hypothetical protein
VEQPPSWWAPSVQPPSRAHQAARRRSPRCAPNVRSCPQSLHCGFFNLCCLLTLIPSFGRYADTGVLSLALLKRLAQSMRVVPSEPGPQPPCAEPLPAQVEEGLPVATVVEESGVPPSSVIEVEESGAPLQQ